MSARTAPVAVGLAAAAVGFAAARGLDNGTRTGSVPPRTQPDAAVSEGRAVFARMGCGSCHRLSAAGSRGQIGPNLDARLAGHTRASLVARITAPAEPADFGAMPSFAGRMSDGELDALVTFLLNVRR